MSLTLVIFLILFGAGSVLAFARHPIYGLVTYTAVFYIHPPSRWWGTVLPDMRWSLLAAFVTLLAVLLRRQPQQGPPLMSHSLMMGLMAFLAWVGVQTLWALDVQMHIQLLTEMTKYALLVGLIYKCVETRAHLMMFLWTHVAGCMYLGWIVYTEYEGGRFEDFGGPNFDANIAALQVTTGLFIGSSLFLAVKLREKLVLFGMMPFIVNALIATVSRSGFLAAGFGGVLFNFFTPRRQRWWVRFLSILAVIMFVLLTNPVYWLRIASLTYAGEAVEGVDTGSDRLIIMEAQLDMFREHPLGCGHRCTAVLSPQYMEDRLLSGVGEARARSSHNTPMTMLTEHGVPGVVFYLLLIYALFRTLMRFRARLRDQDNLDAMLLPGLAAALGAIMVGDLFVDYLKLEVRMWLLATLMVMTKLAVVDSTQVAAGNVKEQPAAPRGWPRRAPQHMRASSPDSTTPAQARSPRRHVDRSSS